MNKRFLLLVIFLSVAVSPFAAQCGACGGCCSELSQEKQQFAAKLNAIHQRLFCAKFDESQQQIAMELTIKKEKSNVEPLTPDQAVQKVAQDNHLLPRAGGACPNKSQEK